MTKKIFHELLTKHLVCCITVIKPCLVFTMSTILLTYLNIMKDVFEYLLVRDAEVWVIVVGVRTRVNDAVHIQVEVVKLWDLRWHAKRHLTPGQG